MKCAVLQPNYIPWKGYFDIIAKVDYFVIYDDVQFTRRDWRSRNVIKTNHGPLWLTIPVNVKGKYHQLISETMTADSKWIRSHLNSIKFAYAGAAFFKEVFPKVEDWYKQLENETSLTKINTILLKNICAYLGIQTHFLLSSELQKSEDRNVRLIEICQHLKCDSYLSGPAAKFYVDEDLFAQSGIKVEWITYDGYPPYRQLHGEFDHFVTVLDLLLNEGPQSKNYLLKGF